MVFASEGFANAWQGKVGALPHQEHAHLAGLAYRSLAASTAHLLYGNAKYLSHLFDHLLWLDIHIAPIWIKHRCHRVYGHWQTGNRDKSHCPGKGSFEFTNIGGKASGDELNQIPGQGHLLLLGFLMQDCHTGFHVWRLDISN